MRLHFPTTLWSSLRYAYIYCIPVANHLYISQPCSRGESSREANRKGRARCGVPGAVCDRTREDNAQHPWSHDPKSSHCCLVQGRTITKCWAGSKKRHGGAPRGAASGRSGAGLSPRKKVRARVRSCTPPDADAASGRLPALRPPLFSGTANGKKKKERRNVSDQKNGSSVGWAK